MWANKHPLEDNTIHVWLSQSEFELVGTIIIMAVPTLLMPKLPIFLPVMHLFVTFTRQ